MDKLEPLINQVVEIIKSTKEFTISQAPDFVKQFLTLSFCQDSGWVILCVVVLAVSLWAAFLVKAHWEYLDELTGSISCIGVGVGLLFGTIGFISNVEGMFEIWLAPKAYLVTHLIAMAHPK